MFLFKKAVIWVLTVLSLVAMGACTTIDVFAFVPTASAAGDTVMVGETAVILKVTARGREPTFIALHENESTSVEAAKAMMAYSGGTLIELKHTGARNLTFRLGGTQYEIDPNRMFTDRGIKVNLRPYSTEAHAAVAALAQRIIRKLSRRVVALHNNTDGGYSILQYQAGQKYANEAAMPPHVVEGQDPDNFFFVTPPNDFARLKKAGFNVVLQAGQPSDDGSLSVYCSRNGINYVNVEAQHGSRKEQIKMLHALLK